MKKRWIAGALVALVSAGAQAGVITSTCSMQIMPAAPNAAGGVMQPAPCGGSSYYYDRMSFTANSRWTSSEQGGELKVYISSDYRIDAPSAFIATRPYDYQWFGSHVFGVDQTYAVTLSGANALFDLSSDWAQSGAVGDDGVYRGTLNPGVLYRIDTRDYLGIRVGGTVAEASGARLYATLTAVPLAVPEPSTLAMLAGGLLAVAAVVRRRPVAPRATAQA